MAEQRYAGIVATGTTVPWNDMRRYFEKKLAGKKVARPHPKVVGR